MKRIGFAGLTSEAAALLLAFAGAGIGFWLNLPLALLIGPMVVLTLASQRFHSLKVSNPLYLVALIILGVYLGEKFTPDLFADIPGMAGSLALNAVTSLIGLALGYILLTRAMGFDQYTATFSALPGGILTVMEVARETRADMQAVLFFQIFRIVLGASAIPLAYSLAGFDVPASGMAAGTVFVPASLHDVAWLAIGSVVFAFLGRLIRFPSAEISIPMIYSGILFGTGTVSMTLPLWLPALGFIIVGAAVGTRLPRLKIGVLARLAVQTAILFVVFICLTILAALIANLLFDISLARGILAYSPASLTEMITVAAALDLDPAFVAANNMFRMVFCSLLAPALAIALNRHLERTGT